MTSLLLNRITIGPQNLLGSGMQLVVPVLSTTSPLRVILPGGKDFLYFHYNPRLQCSNNMCASVFQHIFTALALQLHCSSDKDNKYMLDIFSLQFVRLQLEMKSNIQSFSPSAYNLSSQTFTYQYIHPS